MQEAWWPDDEPAAVDVVAAELGAEIFALALRTRHAPPVAARAARRSRAGHGRTGRSSASCPPAWSARCRSGTCSPTRRRNAAACTSSSTSTGGRSISSGSTCRRGSPTARRSSSDGSRRSFPSRVGPPCVAGDCNFWGPGVRTFLPGWRRAVLGRTWPASRPHSQIDHILVRPEIGVVNSEVLGDVGSDHRPVRATLSIG